MVIDVSAIEVARTTFRRPGGDGVERAEEADDIDVRLAHALFQKLLGAADLAGARQKHQKRAAFGTQCALDRIRDLAFDRRAWIAADITCLHRESPPFAFDHGRFAEQRRDPRAIERRRHHQQLEILPQAELCIAC